MPPRYFISRNPRTHENHVLVSFPEDKGLACITSPEILGFLTWRVCENIFTIVGGVWS